MKSRSPWPDAQPTAGELRLGPAAPLFLPLGATALILAWALGGVALVFAGLMLAVLASGLLFSWLNLRGVELRTRGAQHRTLGEEFLLPLELRRRSTHGAARDLVLARESEGARDPRPAGLVTALIADEPTRTPLALKLTERGRARELCLRIESSFPFGLLRRVVHYRVPVELVGLPRLGSLGDLGRLAAGRNDSAPTQLSSTHEQDEFHSLEEWRAGMSLRRVHWKLSAHRGRPLCVKLEDKSRATLHVVLVTAEAPEASAPSASFEVAVSLTATLCEHYLRRARDVQLSFAGREVTSAPATHGRAGWSACLESLAEVRSELEVPSVDLTAFVEACTARGESVIAVFAGGRRPAQLLQCPAPALQLDVDDAGLDAVFQRGRPFGSGAPLELSDAS